MNDKNSTDKTTGQQGLRNERGNDVQGGDMQGNAGTQGKDQSELGRTSATGGSQRDQQQGGTNAQARQQDTAQQTRDAGGDNATRNQGGNEAQGNAGSNDTTRSQLDQNQGRTESKGNPR